MGLILLYVKARLVGAPDIDDEWVYKLGDLFDDHVICFNTVLELVYVLFLNACWPN